MEISLNATFKTEMLTYGHFKKFLALMISSDQICFPLISLNDFLAQDLDSYNTHLICASAPSNLIEA